MMAATGCRQAKMEKPADNPDPVQATPAGGANAGQVVGACAAKIKGVVFSPETKSLFLYYWLQVKGVLLNPGDFFSQMPAEGNFIEPAIFLCVSAAIYSLLQAIGNLNPFLYIKLVFMSVVSVALGSLIANFSFKLFGGKGTAKGTFAVLAYSKATLLFAWISLGHLQIGGMLSVAYTIYLNVLGMQKVHQMGRIKTTILTIVLAALGLLVKLKTG